MSREGNQDLGKYGVGELKESFSNRKIIKRVTSSSIGDNIYSDHSRTKILITDKKWGQGKTFE